MVKIKHKIIGALIALGISIAIPMTIHADNQDVMDNANVLNNQTEQYIKQVNDNDLAKVKGRPQIAVITEKQVFGDIAKARQAYSSANTPKEKMKAHTQLNQSTGMLINVIHERYPKLESNQNVQDLMTQLEGSENRIATERQNYIATVRAYNQSVVNFPSSIVANAKDCHTIPYYKANDKAQEAPQVNLNN